MTIVIQQRTERVEFEGPGPSFYFASFATKKNPVSLEALR